VPNITVNTIILAMLSCSRVVP